MKKKKGLKKDQMLTIASFYFLFLCKCNIYLSKSILFIHWAEGRKDFGGRTYKAKSGFAEAIKKGSQEIILRDQKSI